jgi:Flp pilus assembly protein TadD
MESLHDDGRHELASRHASRGVTLERAGRYREAAEAYAEVVRLDPADPDAQARLGLVLRELGRDDEANRAFLIALELRGSLALGER